MDPIIGLISGVISLVVLVIYFFMAANISRMKTELSNIKQLLQSSDPTRALNMETAWVNYYKNKSLGKNQEAIEDLVTIVFSQLSDKKLTSEDRLQLYGDLKSTYRKHFREVGGTYPEYPF